MLLEMLAVGMADDLQNNQEQHHNAHHTQIVPGNRLVWKWKGGFFKIAIMTALFSIAMQVLIPTTVINGGVNETVLFAFVVSTVIAIFDGYTYE
jgi:hypothetical protein